MGYTQKGYTVMFGAYCGFNGLPQKTYLKCTKI